MTVDFHAVLAEYKILIVPYINKHLNTNIPGLANEKRVPDFHWQLVADYPNRGGKYLRPTLLCLAAEGLGASLQEALPVAAAMEVCENWVLLHDDIEDDSLLRRGDMTLHRKYSLPLALNAGDVLHLIQWQMIRNTSATLGAESMHRIHDEFFRMLMRTAWGQTEELRLNKQLTKELTETDYYYLVDGKTGYYTIGGPLRLGALIAITDDTRLQTEIFPSLNEFAVNFGRAFQIIDDVLDIESSFEGKKQQGGDIYEGKLTLIVLQALKNLSPSKSDKLLSILNQPRNATTKADLDIALNLMTESGGLAYAKKEALFYAVCANKLLEKMDFLAGKKSVLKAGIDFVVKRTY